jgi:GT2 family glycosyltransferase
VTAIAVRAAPQPVAGVITPPDSVPSLAQQASVIVVAHNSGDLLLDCIASILRAEPQVEIVLVDNASTDGAVERIQTRFPAVRVLRSGQNLGFGAGNNLGAQAANGTYLAFLNPDAAVEPGWLEALIGALQADPGAGMATSQVLQMDKPGVVSACGLELHYAGLALARGSGMRRDAFPEIEEVPAVSGASFAIRKDLFESVGGFDPAFFLYMEDVDLSWRARLAGFRILHVPRSVAYHDYTLQFGPAKTFYQERNRYLMLLKSLRWRTLLLLAPALLLAEAVTWGFVLFRERKHLSNKVRAYGWIVANWPGIRRSRQQTQAIRRVHDRDLVGQCAHRLDYAQTGDGLMAWLAQRVFDPLFLIFHKLALALIRW